MGFEDKLKKQIMRLGGKVETASKVLRADLHCENGDVIQVLDANCELRWLKNRNEVVLSDGVITWQRKQP